MGRQRSIGVVGFPRVLLFALLTLSTTASADWTVTPRGSVSLSTNGVTGIREFSGVTYIGAAGGGLHQFAAIQDDNNQIVAFNVNVAANGAIQSAAAVSARTLSPGSDYEGIAFTGTARNSVFVSEETTPGVHEHSLTTGARLQTVPLPAVFGTRRANNGLESLTRTSLGGVMWTANEQALTIDGPQSTLAVGTLVRLQKMVDNGATTTSGQQFAYRVEPIHAGGSGLASGLVDLIMLPDDTLLAMERSVNASGTPYRTSIHKIDFDGATDISGAPFSGGLMDQTFTPVAKTLLWAGQIGGPPGVGSNVEGLALGPQLESGNWLLLGVADNAGSGATPIVAFELSLAGNAAPGDYNHDGSIDEQDYALWKNTYGSTLALAADGNHNSVVDTADYTVWRNNFGMVTGARVTDNLRDRSVVPEPASAAMLALAVIALLVWL